MKCINDSINVMLSVQGVVRIKPCGVAYWLATVSQVPFAVAFTAYIIYAKRKKQVAHHHEDGKVRRRPISSSCSDWQKLNGEPNETE